VKSKLILFIFLLSSISLNAQNLDLFKKKIHYNAWGDSLLYRMLEPRVSFASCSDTTIKYPLVLFLHGAGERGNDNEKQLIHGAKIFVNQANLINFPCFAIAPQCPENYRWAETDWTLASHTLPEEISFPAKLTMELIDEIIKNYPIDTSRIYITGLSMGGFGTWDLISRFPEKFAAAIPICGGADLKYAPTVKNIPIWAFHGAKDKLVKVSRTRNMIFLIRKEGGKPKYTEYPSLGHFSWNAAYSTKNLLQWMFSQSKIK